MPTVRTSIGSRFTATSIVVLAVWNIGGMPAWPKSPDVRLAEIRSEVMQVAPAPDLLSRIPEIETLARDFEARREPAKAGAALNAALLYALLGGDLRRGVTIADRAAALCRRGSDRRCYGNAMNQSGIALWRQNDPYAAMQRLGRAARAFVAVGDHERAAIARFNSANIRYDIGDLKGALADYDNLDRLYGSSRRWDPVAMLNSKAEVQLRLGQLAAARATSQRAVAMLQARRRSLGTRWESSVASYTMGIAALVEASSGNAAVARRLYEANLRAADRSGSPLERYNANYAYAEGLFTLGQPQAAYGPIRTALALVDETDPAGRRDTFDLASRIAAATGRTTEALGHLRAAEAVRTALASATLRSAINDANAQTAVAEREARMARRDAEWAAQRTRLLGWAAVVVITLILVAVTLVMHFRARLIGQRYAAILGERNRMARELHDTLLQGFTGITLQLRAASRNDPAHIGNVLGAMADEAGRWLSETRHAVWDMRAATADDLRTGLEHAVATARGQGAAEIRLDCSLVEPPNGQVTATLLRVAQEALSNASRHARASRIDVVVRGAAKRIELCVVDDGIGFTSAPELSALGGHWGLLGMRERVEMQGGAFRVDAAPGHGTRITADLPL